MLCRFLPRLTRTAFEEELSTLDIADASVTYTADEVERSMTCNILSCFKLVFFSIKLNLYLQFLQTAYYSLFLQCFLSNSELQVKLKMASCESVKLKFQFIIRRRR